MTKRRLQVLHRSWWPYHLVPACGPGSPPPMPMLRSSSPSAPTSALSPDEDLAKRCRQGSLTCQGQKDSRRERKRSLTARSPSRWAGATTRTSEDSCGLGLRNLEAERTSLYSRITRIQKRLSIPVGERRAKLGGYATMSERYGKQRRLQVLRRLDVVDARLKDGRVSFFGAENTWPRLVTTWTRQR